MKSRYFKIGLFVIGAITLGVIGIIMLGVGKLYREKIMAETYINESVQGLSVGSLVKMRGVDIGTVEQISFVPTIYDLDPDDPTFFQFARYVYIRLGLYKDWVAAAGGGAFEDPRIALEQGVANGLTLKLTPLGLTGVAYLDAEFRDPGAVEALSIAWVPNTTYIPSRPGEIAQLTQTLEKVAKDVQDLDIKGLEADVKGLLAAATKEVKDLQVASIRVRANKLLDELVLTTARAHEMLESPEVNEIIVNLRDTTRNVNAILESDEVRNILTNLEENTALLERTLRRVDNLVSSQQQDIEVIVRDIRLITDSLKELTGNAEKYPSHLIFGEPPPRSKMDNSK
ncbi:MAG: MlaD family protein [Acidiferrobacterales bacterium]